VSSLPHNQTPSFGPAIQLERHRSTRFQTALKAYLIRCLTLVVLLSFSPLGLAQSEGARDAEELGKQALSQKEYPWYDAETDSVKRIDLGERPGIASGERDSIPLQPVAKRAPRANPTNNFNGTGLFEGLSLVAWFAIGGVIMAVLGLLIWGFLRMNHYALDDTSPLPRRSMAESIKQLPFDLATDTGDFRQAAKQAYEQNNFRNAIIFLFSHVLVSLDQKNLIRLRKGKTNRQYLIELRSHRPLADYYQRVMVPFEATFFGDHILERQDFENCWTHLDLFQKDVGQSSQVKHD
jgi:hypothetical protein